MSVAMIVLGCGRPLNVSVDRYGAPPLPALASPNAPMIGPTISDEAAAPAAASVPGADEPPVMAEGAPAPASAVADGSPYVSDLDLPVLVPVMQVQHHPTYAPRTPRLLPLVDAGAYPTAEEAAVRRTWSSPIEIPLAVLGAAWDLVSAPWDMTFGGDPPCDVHLSPPADAYRRLPDRDPGDLSRWAPIVDEGHAE